MSWIGQPRYEPPPAFLRPAERIGQVEEEIRMMLANANSFSPRGVASVDAEFISMGYAGDGQADGPYPGMYEHWSSHRFHEWPDHVHSSSRQLS
jgi:hypothetical protein